jgi:hypothetical protein
MRTEPRPALAPARAPVAAPPRQAFWLFTAACATVAVVLRGYQLSRPGYLTGVTEYDDGVLFGNALRLVSGVIPYRDFAVVQPPGSMLLIAPAALLAKVTGTAGGLAAARLLTVAADTANVILLSRLVRHRGPVAVIVAGGGYAVDPDAIAAAHTFLLEPWLNLFCLAGALLAFDGDRLAGSARRRLAWAGAAFGFAAAVKVWALVPLGVLAVVVLVTSRQDRWPPLPFPRARPGVALLPGRTRWPAGTLAVGGLAAGAVLGLGLPLLPFVSFAPGAVARGVIISQVQRDAGGTASPLTRLADLAGLHLLPGTGPHRTELLVLAAAAVACWAACAAVQRRLTALDAYALAGAGAVTSMFLLPRLYYPHYGAFAAPFLALTAALPLASLSTALTAARATTRPAARTTASPTARTSAHSAARPLAVACVRASPAVTATAVVAAVAGLIVITAAAVQLRGESREYGRPVPAAAARLIPAGACVLTNEAAYTVAANRFYSSAPGCPQLVDSFGTLIEMTGGLAGEAPAAAVRPVAQLWQADLQRAQYVWITSASGGQIPWTSQLSAYFGRHFRLIGLAAADWPRSPVPRPGVYQRR